LWEVLSDFAESVDNGGEGGGRSHGGEDTTEDACDITNNGADDSDDEAKEVTDCATVIG
jgi:hypothetical protein